MYMYIYISNNGNDIIINNSTVRNFGDKSNSLTRGREAKSTVGLDTASRPADY